MIKAALIAVGEKVKRTPRVAWVILFFLLLLLVGLISFWIGRESSDTGQSERNSFLYKIELPPWLNKDELLRLSEEEKNRLNQYIGDALNQLFQKNPPPTKYLPITVVLAQNGQPIFPTIAPGNTNPTVTPSYPASSPPGNPSPTSAAVATPTPSLVPGITYFPTITPSIQPTNNPPATPTPTVTPTVGADLIFVIDPAAAQIYRNYTAQDLADDIDRYYTEAKKIYGPPRKGEYISVLADASAPISFNISTKTISIGNSFDDNMPFGLISAILSAFHGELAYYMPENWEVGLNSVATYEIYKKFFRSVFEDNIQQAGLYDIYNTGALTNIHGLLYNNVYTTHIFPYDLVVTAMYQPYAEDNHFLANLNASLYQEALDNNLYRKIHSLAASIKPVFLGEPFSNWLNQQYILGVQPAAGNYMNIIMFRPLENSPFSLQTLEIDSRGNKHAVGNLGISVTAWDASGTKVWSAQTVSQANGEAHFDSHPQPAENYTGCLKFKIDAPKFYSTYLYYPYENGSPMVYGGRNTLGIFGCVREHQDGNIDAEIWTSPGSGVAANHDLALGSFKLFGLDQFFGSTQMSYFEPNQYGYPATMQNFMKISRNYYLSIPVIPVTITPIPNPFYFDSPGPNPTSGPSPTPTSISTPTPTVKPPTLTPTRTPTPIRTPTPTAAQSSGQSSGDCASGWQSRTSTNFNFSVKYPSTWTHDSPGRSTADNTSLCRFALTDWPYGQAPSSGSRWDNIDVVASRSDLRNYSSDINTTEYSPWLEDATGLQQKSYITFHGLSAEKYVLDLTSAGGPSYTEKYYFKGGNIYYLIRGTVYINSDNSNRSQKMSILSCFMNNFTFLDD